MIHRTILTQIADKTFRAKNAIASQLNTARNWPRFYPEISLGDFNVDGAVDVILKNLSSNSGFSGVDDQMVFSSGLPFAGQAQVSTAIDEDFQRFFSNVAGFLADPDGPDGEGFFNQFTNVTFEENTIVVSTSCGDFDLEYGEEPDDIFDILDGFSGESPCFDEVGTIISTIVDFDPDLVDPRAMKFASAFSVAQNSDFEDEDVITKMENIYSDVMGLQSVSFTTRAGGFQGAFRGEDEEPISGPEVLIGLIFNTQALSNIIFRNPNVDVVLNSDPNTWQRHVYGLNTEICSSTEDTSLIRGQSSQNAPVLPEIIPAEVCTEENVFCWARRRPAPREDHTDDSLAQDGDRETLLGVPGLPFLPDETDPIFTRVDPDNLVYRNETAPTHLLHDPLQAEGCADFDEAPLRTDIDPRRSFVERQVSRGDDGIVRISTRGEGFNPVAALNPADAVVVAPPIVEFYDFVALNELGGILIFNGVDRWIQEQLATRGVCPTED